MPFDPHEWRLPFQWGYPQKIDGLEGEHLIKMDDLGVPLFQETPYFASVPLLPGPFRTRTRRQLLYEAGARRSGGHQRGVTWLTPSELWMGFFKSHCKMDDDLVVAPFREIMMKYVPYV